MVTAMKEFPPAVTTLLFDMDNTLFDLVGAQIAACQSVARHLNQGRRGGSLLILSDGGTWIRVP